MAVGCTSETLDDSESVAGTLEAAQRKGTANNPDAPTGGRSLKKADKSNPPAGATGGAATGEGAKENETTGGGEKTTGDTGD
jgi:hypothetical protein